MKIQSIALLALLAICSATFAGEQITCPSGAEIQSQLVLNYFGPEYHQPFFRVDTKVAGHDATGEATLEHIADPNNAKPISIKLDNEAIAVAADAKSALEFGINIALLTCRYRVVDSYPAFYASGTWGDATVPLNYSEPYLNLLIQIKDKHCTSGKNSFNCN